MPTLEKRPPVAAAPAASDSDWEEILGGPEAPRLSVADVPEPTMGTELGPYLLEGRLAEGGMGTVFKARHLKLDRVVAIKVLHREFLDRPDIVQRFFREARAITMVQHPNIVEVYDYITDESALPHIIMEFLEGENLGSRIGAAAPMDPMECARIGVQIANALSVVHDSGIIHRDLKPDNIFLAVDLHGQTTAKLLDFGIAKMLTSEDEMLRTRTGQTLGTPEYMAPEQIRGDTYDGRVDIYALGAILYEMLTGVLPFESSDINELLIKQLEEDPRTVNEVRRLRGADPVPEWLELLVRTCLAKDPEARFGDTRSVADVLRAKLDPRGTTDMLDLREIEAAIKQRQQRKRRQRRGRGWWLVGAGAAVVAAVIAVIVLTRGDEKKPPPKQAAAPAAEKPAPIPEVEIRSDPSGAAVLSLPGNAQVGTSPLKVKVPREGSARYAVVLAGYQRGTITVEPASRGTLRVSLTRERPKPAPKPAEAMSVANRKRSTSRRRVHRARRPPPRRRRRGPVGTGTFNPFDE